jgi:hypothetical protein
MASLGEFARRMRRRGREVEEGSNHIVRQVAVVAARNLALETPVDTGRARSNWIVNVGAPSREEIEAYFPGRDLGKGERKNFGGVLGQAEAEVENRQPGQDIFISNNLPYIKPLNDGSSAQSPAGFVQTAIDRAAEAVRNARVFRR